METLLPAERQQRIIEILSREFTARSSHLSDLLGVSEMTIRRDLDALEQKGLVERTHGGAVYRQERVAGKFHYRNSIGQNPEEKETIARRAASFIEPNDTLFIGEGVTAAHLVRYADPSMPFTIFTNNLAVISEVGDKAAELNLLGGTYNGITYSLAGPLTMETLRQINATKVFLGADGLSLRAGMTTTDLDIAIIERTMIQQTRGKVIVMANHTKFGLVAEISIVPLKLIDVVVTDRKTPAGFCKNLESLNVSVVIA